MTKDNLTIAKRSKLKYIIPVILIILIILAIIFIPKYNRYLNQKRAAEIRTALTAVQYVVDAQWKSRGSISGITIEQVMEEADISQKIQDRWQFVIAWKLTEIYTTELVEKLKDVSTHQTTYVAPYRMIMAVAKARNPLREGTKVWFIGDTNSFHGFGVDELVEPDWKEIFPNP